MNIFTHDSIWQLITQADLMTKAVLGILLLMSIICWSLALYKHIMLSIKIKQSQTFLKSLPQSPRFEELHTSATNHAKTLPGHLVSSILAQTKHMIPLRNTMGGWQALQTHIDQTVDDLLYQEEAGTGLLSVSADAAPLLGLYGTVWGLIHSFIRIGQHQSADIVTVAPGIAEALITTLAGLLVAIPALALFYSVTTRTKKLENYLYQIADKSLHAARILLDQEPSTSTSQGA